MTNLSLKGVYPEITLSIIIPVYNVADYIDECIDSITPQLQENTELIIIDDGSTDNTLDICQSKAKGVKNITVTSQKNGGVSSARNLGIRMSRGDYLYFVDADDQLTENSIEIILDKLCDAQPDVVMCTAYEFVGTIDNITKYPLSISNNQITKLMRLRGCDILVELMKNQLFSPSMWANIVKKNLFIQNSITFDQRLSNNEDIDCALNLYLNLDTIHVISAPIYRYRKYRDGSASNTYSRKRFDSTLLFIEKWVNNIPKINNPVVKNYTRDYISYQYAILLGSIGLSNKQLRAKFYDEAIINKDLLETGITKKTKIISLLYRLFGFHITRYCLIIFMWWKRLKND